MDDDGVAVTDAVLAVHQVGQLPARRLLRIEDMPVLERQAAQVQEGMDLQAEGVVVGHAEELGVGIERQHVAPPQWFLASAGREFPVW
ncbi:hypothetical protein D3C80_1971830 [compost metagenome]